MAAKIVSEEDRKVMRCITLSESEVREIKELTSVDNLSKALRELIKLAKGMKE